MASYDQIIKRGSRTFRKGDKVWLIVAGSHLQPSKVLAVQGNFARLNLIPGGFECDIQLLRLRRRTDGGTQIVNPKRPKQ